MERELIRIVLDRVNHKGKQILLLKFPYNKELTELVKKLPERSWSNTYKSWYTSYSVDVLHLIKKIFADFASIDAKPLKEKLAAIKEAGPDLTEIRLSEQTIERIEKFRSWMQSRRYSENTVGTYIEALKSFLKFHHKKPIDEITNDDLIIYNNEYILKNKLSSSYQNQVVNGVKLFFRTIQKHNHCLVDFRGSTLNY